jgi:hypothetical protein
MNTPTEDEFYEKYHPLLNHFFNSEDGCGWAGCAYETYGEELDYILSFANNPALQKNVWTIVEGDSGGFVICAGYHIVNRWCYLITDEPWEDEGEYYVCEDLCENEEEGEDE